MSTEAQPGVELPGAETSAPGASQDAGGQIAPSKDDTPLGKLSARLGEIMSRAKHNEMYGVDLVAPESGYANHQ